jgi:hypothetical protein
MRNSIIASAVLISTCLAPTLSSANYYSYERCQNNGGNWFTCLGELADTSGINKENMNILSKSTPEELKFVLKYDMGSVVKLVNESKEMCSEFKGKEQTGCYAASVKDKLKPMK